MRPKSSAAKPPPKPKPRAPSKLNHQVRIIGGQWKRSKLKVIGESFQFLSGGNKGGGGSPAPRSAPDRSHSASGASAAPADDFQEEDDIPF